MRLTSYQASSVFFNHCYSSNWTTDPYGVLEEGQIHFRSSQLITDPESGTHMDIITGPVLASTLVLCKVRPETCD